MGEVYRARDTKLRRNVALKILPEAFALDHDRLARFQREAQTLASLNHPNIAVIHGFEESSGVPALVLELVECIERVGPPRGVRAVLPAAWGVRTPGVAERWDGPGLVARRIRTLLSQRCRDPRRSASPAR